jgi:uncharacterized protein (DUF58 family)
MSAVSPSTKRSLHSAELLAEIKRIELFTRRLVNQQMAGQYQSVFKGRGMSFDEVRLYHPGDDPRTIDWNVTARTGEPHVKVYSEERELTVLILMDASGHMSFGTRGATKQRVAARLAAMMSLSAIANGDRVGLVTFGEGVNSYVPPKKGRSHVLRIIDEVLTSEASGAPDLKGALEFVNRVMRRKAVVFLISDFLGEGAAHALKVTSRRHDLIPLVLTDPAEEKMAQLGLMSVEDAATGEASFYDFGAEGARRYEQAQAARDLALEDLFKRYGLSHIRVKTNDQDYAAPLVNYFKLRARRG